MISWMWIIFDCLNLQEKQESILELVESNIAKTQIPWATYDHKHHEI